MGYDDNRNQPVSMVVDRITNSADKVVDYAYQYYDANGKNNNRIRQITDNIDTAYTTSYLYDDYNRLTNATASAFSRSYQFDPFGNIKNFAGITLNYTTDSTGAPTTNRLTSDSVGLNYSYDAAGNMTGSGQSYSYDGANRLKTASNGTSSYGYDGDGKRVNKAESGLTTYYVLSSVQKNTAMEVTAAGVQASYVYHNGQVTAQLNPDGQFYWRHGNRLGSTRAMTDSNGNLVYKAQHDPYGQILSEWSASGNPGMNKKKFTGYERDLTGLDYANARMYSSGRGAFTRPDPVSTGCSNKNPAPLAGANSAYVLTLNRYTYVNSDPVNLVDRTGHNAQNPDDIPGFCPAEFSSEQCRQNGILRGPYWDAFIGGGGGSGGGTDGPCEKAQIECVNRCMKTPPPWPITKGGHYRYCQFQCLIEYMGCKGAEAAEQAFATLAQAYDWLKNHPEVVIGTIIVVGGVAYIVATGGVGILILVPVV